MNVPPTPTKMRRGNKPKPVWQRLRGQCRWCFKYYTPEDVNEIDELQTLHDLYELYNQVVPFPQPLKTDDEKEYCRIMLLCLRKKLDL